LRALRIRELVMRRYLGIDCGSVSLNLVLLTDGSEEPFCIYRRIRGRSLQTFIDALDDLIKLCGQDVPVQAAMVTGSARDFFAKSLRIGALNEITAHAAGALRVSPQVRTIIEVGGQDSKFMKIEPQAESTAPRVTVFRMNEVCAAGTGAFLDEQADRLGINVESFGSLALQSSRPVPIAGRCAVFAKTDMIHQAQEGTPIPDILMGLALALVRNYIATLIRGESLDPPVALQGGVMHNQAVVRAFQQLLGLPCESLIIPPHFEVLGAMGCAVAAQRGEPAQGLSLRGLRDLAEQALARPPQRSYCAPLMPSRRPQGTALCGEPPRKAGAVRRSSRRTRSVSPVSIGTHRNDLLVLGLDVGSVSVKGVLVDSEGRVVKQDYRLSRSRPLESADEVVRFLTEGGLVPDAVAVTGSGRYLIGRLLQADVIVNEIVAQAHAAVNLDPRVETVVEIGGQDSKWIRLERGRVVDFEMNRVCAAGTGSFLMAQANRLGLDMGSAFSDAAFASTRPADLGNRCTVFMESDLIHHQNSGASVSDLAAGVCISIVQNYLDRVAHHKPIGERVMFLGGVAATDAVRVALEQQTGKLFHTSPFHQVSGALGAALKGLEHLGRHGIEHRQRQSITYDPARISTEQFQCRGCPNECLVRKYSHDRHVIFNGGLCDRWEVEKTSVSASREDDPLTFRARLIEHEGPPLADATAEWGVVRSPQFHEWFPFWSAFCNSLGINLKKAPPSNRKQFEKGARFLRVETCLPMKVVAGQVEELARQGIKQVFHPVMLNEENPESGSKPLAHCAYVQACQQLFRGIWDLEWMGPVVSLDLDPGALEREYTRFARTLGFSHEEAVSAIESGFEHLSHFHHRLRQEGERFLNSLGYGDKALIILGKPYHTADTFLNMNLGALLRRLGIPALPSDLYPLSDQGTPADPYWKYQNTVTRAAVEMAAEPNLFPVWITFFGCGPDPFTLRHVEGALKGRPLLVLEMDEHTSRAGVTTRLEAFLERVHRAPRGSRRLRPVPTPADEPEAVVDSTTPAAATSLLERARGLWPLSWDDIPGFAEEPPRVSRSARPRFLYLPFLGGLSFGMAAAGRSFDIDARVLPLPDEESERLGRPHVMGGECHPYVLVLGEYLKIAQSLRPDEAARSRFYMLSEDACRLGQWPIYIEKVRQQLGLSTGVILSVNHGLASFGLSPRSRARLLLKTWEGTNAYDLLARVFYEVRAGTRNKEALDRLYSDCCERLFAAISRGRLHEGMEEAFHALSAVPRDDVEPKPQVVVTGDYYTRIVPFANNDVYLEVEALGGALRPPPSFSDCFKMSVLRNSVWSALNGQAFAAARHGLLYFLMAMSEFRLRGSKEARRALDAPWDIAGLQMWKTVAGHAETRLPAGITAPISTVLQEIEHSADGILNLMTLNCSYGTVVTAALSRVLKQQQGVPMLTLIYDGLKKTNEKTRLEAFMEQVRDRFEQRMARTFKKCAY
jgi:predicted CoA-substrate-specific enzyme activase